MFRITEQGSAQSAGDLVTLVSLDSDGTTVTLVWGSDRALAARALIRMGQCYEKLGDAQAHAAYEQVVREFGDQKEAVEQARALLSATGQPKQPESATTAQQVWVLAHGRQTQMRHVSGDGRYIPFQSSGSRWLHYFTTGEDRSVIKSQGDGEFLDSPEFSPDAKQLAYTRTAPKNGQSSYQLRITSVDGSRTRSLFDNNERFLWPKSWTPGGKHVLVLMRKDANPGPAFSLALVSATDGSVRVLTTPDDAISSSGSDRFRE